VPPPPLGRPQGEHPQSAIFGVVEKMAVKSSPDTVGVLVHQGQEAVAAPLGQEAAPPLGRPKESTPQSAIFGGSGEEGRGKAALGLGLEGAGATVQRGGCAAGGESESEVEGEGEGVGEGYRGCCYGCGRGWGWGVAGPHGRGSFLGSDWNGGGSGGRRRNVGRRERGGGVLGGGEMLGGGGGGGLLGGGDSPLSGAARSPMRQHWARLMQTIERARPRAASWEDRKLGASTDNSLNSYNSNSNNGVNGTNGTVGVYDSAGGDMGGAYARGHGVGAGSDLEPHMYQSQNEYRHEQEQGHQWMQSDVQGQGEEEGGTLGCTRGYSWEEEYCCSTGTAGQG